MNTNFMLVCFSLIALTISNASEPLVSLASPEMSLKFEVIIACRASEGLVDVGQGPTWCRVLSIGVGGRDVNRLKEFTEMHKHQKIDVYLAGVKVASPTIVEVIEDGAIEIVLPDEQSLTKIVELLEAYYEEHL